MSLDPSNPRSLVGATMGARKRAARLLIVGHPFKRRLKLVWARAFFRDNGGFYGPYYDARALMRIGQRLRPCPGCCGCNPGPNCPCSDATYCCNGSGVLPAHRSTKEKTDGSA